MRRNPLASRLMSLAKPWLAGLLVLLWFAVAAEAVGHHCESDHPVHDCAACQLAHGSLLADGSTSVPVLTIGFACGIPLLVVHPACDSSDLLLSPGRAPPV